MFIHRIINILEVLIQNCNLLLVFSLRRRSFKPDFYDRNIDFLDDISDLTLDLLASTDEGLCSPHDLV